MRNEDSSVSIYKALMKKMGLVGDLGDIRNIISSLDN
jgi:hypothetical protein